MAEQKELFFNTIIMRKTMRKIFTLMFAVMLAGQAWAQEFVVDNFKYKIIDAEEHYVSIGAADTSQIIGDLVIPSTVENDGVTYTITEISWGGFAACNKLTSVIISNTVTRIGESSFPGCLKLKSVTIPNSVKSIGAWAFDDCLSLTSVTIPSSVKNIERCAFQGCDNLTKAEFASIESLLEIDFGPFYANPLWSAHSLYINGTEVTEIVIPNTINRIGSYAFEGCSGLTSVIIPNSVKSIGTGAFLDCDNLSKAEFASIEHLLEIDFESYYSNPLSCAHRLCISGTEVTELEIPNTIDSIGDYTFAGWRGLTSVTIPNSVTSIGEGAFDDCYNITSITIPTSVTSICKEAFWNCYNISSITIPNTVASIGEDAFCMAKNIIYSGNAEGSPWGALTVNGIIEGDFVYSDAEKTHLTAYIGNGGDIVIPDAVVNIGQYAFYHCTNLKSVTIPNTVDTIGYYAFAGCVATIYCDFKERPNGWDYNWNGHVFKGEIIWQTGTPVTETAANAVNIYTYGNTIVVENATDEICVYDAMGRLVARRDVAHIVSTNEIRVNNTGLYIVKVGKVAKRVMVNN